MENFNKTIIELSRKIDVEIDEQMCKQFYQYMKLLLEWNEKINLTAITEENEVILKHFIDSLTINKYIEEGETIIDIGTGAGFPGIPLAITKMENKITLVDSLNKRINFLLKVKDALNLNNVEAIHGRVEEIGKNCNHREHYNVVTSRAVAKLNVLLEYMMPLVKVGGKCICMKGSNIDEEIEQSKKALNILGGEIIEVDKMVLPSTDISRNIILIKKVRETPKQYPRKPGTPAKEPIA